jgi:hypothetical protein
VVYWSLDCSTPNCTLQQIGEKNCKKVHRSKDLREKFARGNPCEALQFSILFP